jgi:hypothetical protein
MKTQMHTLIAIFAIFFGLIAVAAHAQAPSKVVVNIPFDFSAGKTTLKAGTYMIKRMSADNLSLRRDDGQSVILNAPVTHTSTDPNAFERLVFGKAGEQYFLSEIWLTADSGRQIRTEKKGNKSERIEIALRSK